MAIGTTNVAQGNSASASVTLSSTAASGSTFLVLVVWSSGTTFSSISDTYTNGWTQIGTQQSLGVGNLARWYYASSGFSGGSSHAFTVGLSGSTFWSISAVEVTSVNTSSLLTGTPVFETNATSPYNSSSLTTTNANAMLLCCAAGDASSGTSTYAADSSASPTSGWTVQSGATYTDASTNWTQSHKTQAVTATGTYNAGWTITGASNAIVGIIAINDAVAGPTITDQPDDATAYSGQTVQFTVAATGTGTLTYQWERSTNGGSSWSNVSGGSGGTSATYTTPTLGFTENNYLYRCVVTDDNGSTNSSGARLTLIPASSISWLRA